MLFWQRPGRSAAKQPLLAWFKEAQKAVWLGPADIKASFRSADFVAGNRVIFNIGGNKFRLVVAIKYATDDRMGIVFIKFIGTHAEYDNVDAATVEESS